MKIGKPGNAKRKVHSTINKFESWVRDTLPILLFGLSVFPFLAWFINFTLKTHLYLQISPALAYTYSLLKKIVTWKNVISLLYEGLIANQGNHIPRSWEPLGACNPKFPHQQGRGFRESGPSTSVLILQLRDPSLLISPDFVTYSVRLIITVTPSGKFIPMSVMRMLKYSQLHWLDQDHKAHKCTNWDSKSGIFIINIVFWEKMLVFSLHAILVWPHFWIWNELNTLTVWVSFGGICFDEETTDILLFL